MRLQMVVGSRIGRVGASRGGRIAATRRRQRGGGTTRLARSIAGAAQAKRRHALHARDGRTGHRVARRDEQIGQRRVQYANLAHLAVGGGQPDVVVAQRVLNVLVVVRAGRGAHELASTRKNIICVTLFEAKSGKQKVKNVICDLLEDRRDFSE